MRKKPASAIVELMNQKGFGAILVIITASLAIGVGFFLFINAPKNQEKASQSTPTQNKSQTNNPKSSNSDEPPLKLKNIGVNLDYYDPKTNKAGDFEFTKEKLEFNRLFMGYGFVIPGSVSSSQKDKSNPQPTFVVPLGTPVRSLVDGIVAAMPTLWSGDYSIQVTTDGKMQKWVYETEHLINPKVKVGDKVVAGQIVGEVSDFNNGAPPGFGAVEIGILKGGNPPQHVCPFTYLDESIKEETFKKINDLFKSWEDYTGNQTLYNETKIPGCLSLDPIDG